MKLKLNRSQRLGLDIDKHMAISAGAGTGKTSVMALRYIEHLLNTEQRATVLLPPSSRRPLQGPGSLRAPKREQINLKEWAGLLPSECVAITFTNDAADELRYRIRTHLLDKRKLNDDPRINKKGLIEQMLSLLDDAPIGTIDSFFSKLLRPWMSLVNEFPTNENVSDEKRPLLTKEAINIAWRIRNEKDSFEAGLTSDFNIFINARNRLSLGLGGRFTAEKVLAELLNQSLFVEESESKINQLYVKGMGKNEAIIDYIKKMMIDICKPGLDSLNELYTLGFNWLNGCTKFSAQLNLEEAIKNRTRYAAFDDLIRSGLPSDDWEKLQWLSHFEFITTSENAYNKMASKSSSMPLGMLPNRDKNWPSGINSRSSIKGNKDKERSKIEIIEVGQRISQLLSNPIFVQLRRVSRCAWFFDPTYGCPQHPEGSLRGSKIVTQLGVTPPETNLIASKQLQIDLLEDLFIVQHGIQSILRNIKNLQGVHDYSDIQRLSEDLLLARCPDICRMWYPKEVIASLDKLPKNPWEDSHIQNALYFSKKYKDVFDDLTHRFDILKSLRRKFRTFIIDEYQDTNPQQYRLLCRLFGRRKLEIGELEPPKSSWDPTVCIVGDLKQSIFRFRQAQVTVMLNTISIIKEINKNEISNELRIINLRKKQGVKEGYGRDPRPLPSKFKTNKFQTAETFEYKLEGSNENLLSCKLGDNDEILDFETQSDRNLGHLKLSMNYRTDGALLMTLNEVFEDLFSAEKDIIKGDWYARPQYLLASNDLKYKRGKIEWILPTAHEEIEDQKKNLKIPLSPFANNNLSKPYEKEFELLSARLFALIHGYDTRILGKNKEKMEWLKLPNDKKVNPEDIMILVQKRTHISDLIKRLSNWGIPAIVDRQSGLLERPIVKALYDLLNSAIYPNNKTIFSSLLRSELVCFSDNQLHKFIKNINEEYNLFDLLINDVKDERQKQMYCRWKELSKSRNFVTLLEDTLDYSDLLTIYFNS